MMLLRCCTQYASRFGKLSSGHRTGKVSFHDSRFYFSGSQLSHLKSEEDEVDPWLPNTLLNMDTFLERLSGIHPTYSNKADSTQAALVGAARRGKGPASPTRSPPAASHRRVSGDL